MEKKQISKSDLNFLQGELKFWEKNNIIDQPKQAEILSLYETSSLNFIKIILAIGSVLIGLGILSFFASNWDVMSKLTKFLLIVFLYIGSNAVSFLLQHKYPKTSTSLLYLGVLIYGAGIFLIGQMFNYGGNFNTLAFLLWGAGILPFAYLFKEKIIFIFSNVLFLIYINNLFAKSGTSYWLLILVPLLYYINYTLDNFEIGTFFNNLVLLNAIGYYLGELDLEGFYITLIYMAIGFVLYYAPIKTNSGTHKFIGLMTIGVSGLFLTDKSLWDNFKVFGDGITASIVFSVAFVLFLFNMLRKGLLLPLVFICGVILKFYFDTFYDFMSKSVFFIIGGVILILFGFYFERLRNKKGADVYEK
jgi:uncharacterized membrane protein